MRDKPVLTLALLTGVMFLLFLGAHPYITPSEARYIEVARQMVVTGDWVVPHIDGVPYFEKPPLFYWMESAVFSVFGWGEFAGRFLTALLSVALCLLTYELGRMLVSRRAGMAAALALGTSWLGFSLSRIVMLDVPLTVCVTGVLLCFLKAERKYKPRHIYGMYVFAAAGVMTKGLIGAVLPGMVIFFWLLLARKWAVLAKMRLPTGTLLFLALVLPWHFAAGRRYPEFWHFYFIYEHFTRFLNDSHHRDQPWWFFIAVALGGWMPWTFFFPPVLKKAWAKRRDPSTLFLLLWAALPFLFFSASHSKLVPYIYPIFPPLAVLLAPRLLKLWNKRRPLLVALGLSTPLIGYAVQVISPQVWRGSVKPVALALQKVLKPGDEVVLFQTYRQDMPVYLNRNVTIVAYDGELEFGHSIEPRTRGWMIGPDEFWRRCDDHHVYVLMDRRTYGALHAPPGCALKPANIGAEPPERFVLLTNGK